MFKPVTFQVIGIIGLILGVGLTLSLISLEGFHLEWIIISLIFFLVCMFFASVLDMLKRIRNSNRKMKELLILQLKMNAGEKVEIPEDKKYDNYQEMIENEI